MSESNINIAIRPGTILSTVEGETMRATVVDRPNRFTVIAELGTEEIRCHLHDPGRLKELIYPGNTIMVRAKQGPKTSHSVVSALYGEEWVLIDSRFHPGIARKFLPPEAQAEVKVGRKRLDFMCGDEYIEVKGCTLLEGTTAKFPDAPSVRAAEHLRLLEKLHSEGHQCSVMFLIIREGAHCFLPNRSTDPVFADALLSAMKSGVSAFFMGMHFDGRSVIFDREVEMCSEPVM